MAHRCSNRSPGKHCHALLFVVVQAMLFGAAHAQTTSPKATTLAKADTFDYELGLSLLHSDNIGLSETDPASENVLSPRLSFDLFHSGSRLDLQAQGDLQYLDYLNNTFDDQPRGQLTGKLNWTAVPGRVSFVVQDYLSRQPVDVLTAFTPGNDQQVNVFVAGPSFFARLGSTTRGQLDLRYTNSYAQENKAFNGDRYNIAGRILRELSPTDRLGINLEHSQVNLDAASTVPGYSRNDGYIGYSSVLAALELSLDAGYSRVELDGSGGSISGSLLRGKVNWKPTSRSTLSAEASRQFADAAEDLVARAGNIDTPIISDVTAPDVLVGPNVFRQQRYELGYAFTGTRLTAEVHPYYQRIHYLDGLTPDQSSSGGYAQLNYRLRESTSLSAVVAHSRRTFSALDRRDSDSVAGISLARQFSRHWSGQVDFQFRKRNSTDIGQSYDENAIIVSFSYRR